MFDVAVIGAGVVGGLIARELVRRGAHVCILEAGGDVALGATRANSAIVHAGFDAKEGSLKARLNVRGSEMMEELCSELGVKYNRCGSLVVGFSDEDKRTLGELLLRGERNGVKELRLLSRDEVREIEPNVGESVTCALYAPSGAIVCPYELCLASVGCAVDNGAVLRRSFKVDRAERVDGVFRIYSGEKLVEAKYAVNCAGACSDDVARLFGDDSFLVHARRGEYILLDRACGGHIKHTIFRCPSKMGKGVLVTPTVDGNILIGPTAEDINDKFDTRTTHKGALDIKKKASEQVSCLDFSKTITSFAGLRSTGSTGDFIINSPCEAFVNAAGIESPGLSASPAIAEYVCDLLEGIGARFVPKEDFVSKRLPLGYFKDMSDEEKNRLIAERREFGRIVCRCEMVTEGEIIDAICREPGARDVDGIKRRTRATMGRCQGGFCTPYIVEILARELGVEYTEVTKSGGASYMNVGRTKG